MGSNNRKAYVEKYNKLMNYLSHNPNIPVEWIKQIQIGYVPSIHEVFIWNGKSNYGFTIFPVVIYDNIWTNPRSNLTTADCNSNTIWDVVYPLFDNFYTKKSKKELKSYYGKSLDSVVNNVEQIRNKLKSKQGTISYKELLNYQIFINLSIKNDRAEFMKEQKDFIQSKVDARTKAETNMLFQDIFQTEQEK